jgi:hypothetical protein
MVDGSDDKDFSSGWEIWMNEVWTNRTWVISRPPRPFSLLGAYFFLILAFLVTPPLCLEVAVIVC